MNHLISPSILSADFGNLERDIRMLNDSKADWIHCDVMDGAFVPNISFGFPILQAVKKVATKPLDVHLMVIDPDRYIDDFKKAGADILTVQHEANTHLDRTINAIKEAGMKAGVALNPGTPVEVLTDVLGVLDMVLIMSVNPGYGGQKFIPYSLDKIRRIRSMIDERGLSVLIQVDGGVNGHNSLEVLQAGADVLVAGSFVFNSEDPLKTIEEMKNLSPDLKRA